MKNIKMPRLSWTTGTSCIPSSSVTDDLQREAGRTLRIRRKAPKVSMEPEVGKVILTAKIVDSYQKV